MKPLLFFRSFDFFWETVPRACYQKGPRGVFIDIEGTSDLREIAIVTFQVRCNVYTYRFSPIYSLVTSKIGHWTCIKHFYIGTSALGGVVLHRLSVDIFAKPRSEENLDMIWLPTCVRIFK